MAAKPIPRARSSHPLDHVRLTQNEREAARQSMEQGERIAEFLVGVMTAAASIVRGITPGLHARARTKSAN